MMKNPILEGCENEIEGTDQPMNEVLVMPYRFIEPTVFYKEVFGRLRGTVGYRIQYRHFRQSLIPFNNLNNLANLSLYFIMLNGECKEIPLKKAFLKKSLTGRYLCVIPLE